MNLLVVAATGLEIQPFIQNNNGTDVLITGPGVPATVFNLMKQLAKKNYDLAIQAGIGGAFNNRYKTRHCGND